VESWHTFYHEKFDLAAYLSQLILFIFLGVHVIIYICISMKSEGIVHTTFMPGWVGVGKSIYILMIECNLSFTTSYKSRFYHVTNKFSSIQNNNI